MYNPFIPAINSLLAEPQAGLLNGILFGVKASIPKDLYSALVTTGTLHIIALSGMNISILANLTAKTTLFLGKKLSIVITLLFIWLFVIYVGFSPSVVRAAIMGCLSLLSVYFGRQYWGVLSLFLTSLIMLLIDFSLINNLSFQLSFLATLGIILANKKNVCQKSKRLIDQILSGVKLNFRLTLSAQLFTLPVILYNFHRISLIAPLANILIEWSIQPIMVLGFATGLFAWIWKPLGVIPAWLTWVPLSYLITIVEILAKLPGASVQF